MHKSQEISNSEPGVVYTFFHVGINPISIDTCKRICVMFSDFVIHQITLAITPIKKQEISTLFKFLNDPVFIAHANIRSVIKAFAVGSMLFIQSPVNFL